MEDFVKTIIGNLSMGTFLGFIFWILVGFLLFQFMEISERNPDSKRTPREFNFRFWIKDNWKRIVVTVLLIIVNIRFWNNLTGSELSPYTAFLVGFGSDGISGFLKNRVKRIKADRDKL